MHPSSVTLIGRYEVLALLGRGAMGVVYQARDPQIDRLVAIKTILWLGDDEADAHAYRERFLQEAKAAGRLSHPGIVQVFDVGEDVESHAPFIVMEYVAGQSLNKLLSASPGTKLPLERALRLTQEIAEALAYAHSQGVVHRDIKPANILVTEDGHAKIADFGVAKLDFSNLTLAGHAVGTPAYMAPEQLAGGPVDGRADLFSLGVILYSMLSGFRPFQGRGNSTIAHKVRHGEPLPVSAFDVKLPADVDALLSRAMAKDPAERFQSGAEMAAAIRELRGIDGPSTTSTDARSVMLETRAHVACMDPDKNGTGTNQQKANTAAAQKKKAQPAKAASRPKTKKDTESKKSGVGVSSRRALATALAASLLAACALAWRLHDAIQPKVISSPVTWENAQPAQPATAETASPVTIPPAEAPVTEAALAPKAKTKKVASSPKAERENKAEPENNEVAQDTTIRLSPRVVPAKATARVTTAATSAPAPLQQLAAAPATVQLAVEHGFSEAQLTVWVGDRQVLTETLRGAKKRVLMFQRTRGSFEDKISIPAGAHLVRVRVQAASDKFDAAQSVNGDFTNAGRYVLHARCDKRKNELSLDLETVSSTPAVASTAR